MKNNDDDIQAAMNLVEDITKLNRKLIRAIGAKDSNEESSLRGKLQAQVYGVSVREGWKQPGSGEADLNEFMLVLSSGGPTVKIVGELDCDDRPVEARLIVQGAGPEHTIILTGEQQRAIDDLAAEFCYTDSNEISRDNAAGKIRL